MPEPAPTNSPDVSITVVSWRSRDLTLACLRSAVRAAAADGVAIEVILVDNASDDGTVEAVRAELPTVTVVACSRNLGYAAACNIGAARSRGRYLLMLNSDATLPVGALESIVGFLDRTPGAAALGCRLEAPDGTLQFACGRFLTPFNQFAEILGLSKLVRSPRARRSYSDAELRGAYPEVDWAIGACLTVRRTAFEQMGGFDEQFFMYSEDEDLCRRLRSAGHSVHILTETRVRHVGGGSAERALEPMRAAMRSSQRALIRKHGGRYDAIMFAVLMRIASLKPSRRSRVVGWGR